MVHSSNLLTTLSQYLYVNTALLHVNDSWKKLHIFLKLWLRCQTVTSGLNAATRITAMRKVIPRKSP